MVRICKRRRLDEKESRHYIRQIVSALDHLHAHGVLHRLVCGCARVCGCAGVRVCGRTGARACTGEHIRAYRRSRRLVCGCANLCAGVRTCVRVCGCAAVRGCIILADTRVTPCGYSLVWLLWQQYTHLCFIIKTLRTEQT